MRSYLEELVELIGEDKALNLAQQVKMNGKKRELYIPRRTHQDHFIARCVGFEVMQILCKEWGGIQITLASPERYLKRKRIRCLLEDPCNHISEIAKIIGCSRNQVYALWG